MSEFHCPVVRVGEINRHPNADTLSTTNVFAYPVIIRTGDFHLGDLAVYVPVDAVVPNSPLFSFLCGDKPNARIKAKRLRGIFSMGLLVPADPEFQEGQDVTTILGIERYEPPEPASMGEENETDPGFIPVYTDIEGFRRWPNVLPEGREVVILEKFHGANGRFAFNENRLWVGSHTRIKKESDSVIWWKVARQYNLAEKLVQAPGIVIYGEAYGQVRGFSYGAGGKGQVGLALFDALDITTRKYLDWDDFCTLTDKLALPRVPLLYRGAWSKDLLSLAEGKSTVEGADHVREGFVVKPTCQFISPNLGGRVILKMIGEGYLLH